MGVGASDRVGVRREVADAEVVVESLLPRELVLVRAYDPVLRDVDGELVPVPAST